LLRIAICDDMPDFLARANSLVSAWKNDPENVIIELFSDGDSLIDVHIKNPFDIILLDIVMPLMNGIDTAAQIRKNDKSVKLVFLTSSPEFAIESYSVQANGYLLKPIDKDKLYSCLDHLYSSIADNTKYIMIKDAASVHRIELRSIEYAESQGKHVIFTLYDSSQIKSSEPFYVYNVHTDHKGSVARALASSQLLQDITSHGAPFFMTGDFNATPDAPEIQMITACRARRSPISEPVVTVGTSIS